jgi:hypothetical protein
MFSCEGKVVFGSKQTELTKMFSPLADWIAGGL